MKFKVGDRVRIKSPDTSFNKEGEFGVIKYGGIVFDWIVIVGREELPYDEHELDLVNKQMLFDFMYV